MVDDSERREVARRLREAASYYESMERDVDFYPVESALGLKPAGETAYTLESVRSLADLIDPDEMKTTCIAEVKIEGEKLDEVVNRAIAEYTGIDRDALLALAEEAKKCAWYFGLNHDNDELKDRLEEAAADFSDFAKRIREVLEVTE